MRKKTAAAATVAAGALVISGLVLAGPALAATDPPAPPTTGSAPAEPGAGRGDGTARTDRLREALAPLVTDGTLTQEQADEVADTLAAADPGPGGRGGPGGMGGGPGRDLSTAATALGITEDELRTALEGDRTLAQVAEDEGVPVQTLIDALVEAEKARIAQAVTDGRITQAQADERLADVTEHVTERVNEAGGARPNGGPGH